MTDLYDSDILIWSEQQAALLRRAAAGERVNDQIDWSNIIEEVESVGQNQLDAVESLLFQAFVHDLKAQAWPHSREVESWRGDARGFRAQARRKYRSSMRRRLDIAGIYRDALEALPATLDGLPPESVPQECPVSLDELLAAPPLPRPPAL
jgi:hypothetical protein